MQVPAHRSLHRHRAIARYKLFDLAQLVLGQQLGMHFVNADCDNESEVTTPIWSMLWKFENIADGGNHEDRGRYDRTLWRVFGCYLRNSPRFSGLVARNGSL